MLINSTSIFSINPKFDIFPFCNLGKTFQSLENAMMLRMIVWFDWNYIFKFILMSKKDLNFD